MGEGFKLGPHPKRHRHLDALPVTEHHQVDTLPRLSLPGCGEQIHPVVDRCSFKLNHDITGAKTRGGARALRHHSLHDGTLVACRTRLALT